MPIIAKNSGNYTFHLTPAGTFQAVCYNVWDLGLQESEWSGKKIVQHKVIIGWEIDEVIESADEYNGKRYVVSNKYTLSLNDKARLNKDLTSWRGKPFTDEEKKGFDIEKLIGVNCMLNIVHTISGDRTYANISGVIKLTKNMMPVKAENPRMTPVWIQKMIDNPAKAEQENGSDAEEVSSESSNDEPLPF